MRYTKINSKYKTITCSGVKSSRKRGYSAYVPLLYFENNSTHSCVLLAKRLATMTRIHSKTIPFSVMYFHKSGFELPIVVSWDTCLLKIQSCVRYAKNSTGRYELSLSHQLIIIKVILIWTFKRHLTSKIIYHYLKSIRRQHYMYCI